MAEILTWAGSDVLPKGQRHVAADLASYSEHMAEALEAIKQVDGCEDLAPELAAAIGRLERAYRMLLPLFTLADMPPAERLRRSPRFNDVVTEAALAEIELTAILARARAEWLSRYCRGED